MATNIRRFDCSDFQTREEELELHECQVTQTSISLEPKRKRQRGNSQSLSKVRPKQYLGQSQPVRWFPRYHFDFDLPIPWVFEMGTHRPGRGGRVRGAKPSPSGGTGGKEKEWKKEGEATGPAGEAEYEFRCLKFQLFLFPQNFLLIFFFDNEEGTAFE